MHVSCCAYSYRQFLQNGDMNLEDFLQTAANIGCDGVELTSYYFPNTETAYLHHIKREMLRLGLNASATAVGSNFAQADADARKAHVKMTCDWADYSVHLGAPALRVFAGDPPDDLPREQAFEQVVECLVECAEYAGKRGITLALENHWGLTTTAEMTLTLLHAVDSDWLRLNLDFGNFSGDTMRQYALCAPYAVITHAKRNLASSPERPLIDYTSICKLMQEVGYNGYLAVEYEESGDPRKEVPLFVRELQRILSVI